MDLKLRRSKRANVLRWESEEGEYDRQTVSPPSQILCSSPLSLYIHVIYEFERPIDVVQSRQALIDIFLPLNPRFSSVMKRDEHGAVYWEKTEVNVDDHVVIVEFPPDRTEEEYNELVKDYISSINANMRPLDQSRPPWEFQVINYKTTGAGSTLIVNVHHSLGDGISLMSLLFAGVRRADNPALRPTFPTPNLTTSSAQKSRLTNIYSKIFHYVLLLWYTIWDLIDSFVKTHDCELPIRGPPGVECLPIEISSTYFQMDDIREIKNSIEDGVTVNDVITGIIFKGIRRYLNRCLASPPDDNLRITALVLINTRAVSGLQDLSEMIKPNAKAPWGNRFGFLRLPIPAGKSDNTLDFVRRARRILYRKKMSFGVHLTAKFLSYVAYFRGPQASAKYMYNALASSTLTISNLVGPMEKMAMIGNPIKGFCFFVSGAPLTLQASIVSYMGNVRLQVAAAKGYVDVDILSSCFAEAFQEMKVASVV